MIPSPHAPRDFLGSLTPGTRRVVLVASALLLALVYLWSFNRGVSQIPKGMGDFVHFFKAALAMREGTDIFASGTRGYIYPPLIAFLYMPLAALPFEAAARTDLAINIVLSAATLILASRESLKRVGLRAAPVGVVLVAAAVGLMMADKIRIELRMGQTDVLMLLCFTLGLVWINRRPALAGTVLGIAFNIKYLPIVFLPYLLVRRRWRAAAAFVLSIACFSLLPALRTGWQTNLHNLGVAYAGLLNLVGLGASGPAAQIQSISAPLSVSVTSAMARAFGGDGAATLGTGVGLAIGLGFLGVWAWAYWRHQAPIVDWAKNSPHDPGLALLELFEWTSLLVFVLAFSPQTNMRHIYMTLLPIAAGVALLVKVPPACRVLVVVSLLAGVLSLNLPPGGGETNRAVEFWHAHGGPGWGILVMQTGLVWAATREYHRIFQARTKTESTPVVAGNRQPGTDHSAVTLP